MIAAGFKLGIGNYRVKLVGKLTQRPLLAWEWHAITLTRPFHGGGMPRLLTLVLLSRRPKVHTNQERSLQLNVAQNGDCLVNLAFCAKFSQILSQIFHMAEVLWPAFEVLKLYKQVAESIS